MLLWRRLWLLRPPRASSVHGQAELRLGRSRPKGAESRAKRTGEWIMMCTGSCPARGCSRTKRDGSWRSRRRIESHAISTLKLQPMARTGDMDIVAMMTWTARLRSNEAPMHCAHLFSQAFQSAVHVLQLHCNFGLVAPVWSARACPV